jgi:hypothetical protein
MVAGQNVVAGIGDRTEGMRYISARPIKHYPIVVNEFLDNI